MKSLMFALPGPVHVADFGGSGPPIILLHGIGGSHTNWWSVAPQLTDHGRVLAVDLVGCGYTPPAGRHCRLSTNQQMLEQLIARLGEPVTLVGHSMGGLLALLTTAAATVPIRRLVLLDPSQRGEAPAFNPTFLAQLILPSIPLIGDELLHRTIGPKTAAERIRDGWNVSMVDQSRVDPAARHAAEQMAMFWLNQPWHRSSIATAIASTGRALIDPKRYERAVDTNHAPTLLLHGSNDHLISRGKIEQLAARRPDWTTHFFDDVGHNPHLEAAPAVVSQLTAWFETSGV